MKDVIHVQVVAPHFEVEPELTRAQSIEGPGSPAEVTQRFPGMSQFRRLQAADGMNSLQLRVKVELVQLVHRLI